MKMARRPAARVGLVGLAAMLVSGCAGLKPSAQGSGLPAITRGSRVIVYMRWPGDDPYPTAERACRALGARPEPRTISPSNASFNCVKDRAAAAASPAP